MNHEWALARAFVGIGSSGRLHSSFLVSIFGVLLGVAFLVLTLGVYDSYVDKLETIAFALYPHVLLVDGQSLRGSPDASQAPHADMEKASHTLDDLDHDEAESDFSAGLCERICGGETLFQTENLNVVLSELGVEPTRLAELDHALTLASRDASGLSPVMAPVILEESDLSLYPTDALVGGQASLALQSSEVQGAFRPIRVLGIDPGASPMVPRVDLVLSPQQIDRLQREPSTVFLASVLWEAIAPADTTSRQIRVSRPNAPPFDLPFGGEFELGFHAVAHNLVITSLETARQLLGLDRGASYVGIALEDPYRSREYLHGMETVFDQVDFRATDWTRVAGGDFESIRLFRWILFLVLGLSFLITALGIRNALAILTLERRRQIGILRALGSRDRSLRLIFLTIACGIGLTGALPGALLGSWLGIVFGQWLDQELAGILPLRGVEVAWQPMALGQVLVLVLMVCALTSMVAVNRALELDTVACLREE